MTLIRDRWFWFWNGNGGPTERLVRAIAWRLPRSVAYWASVRVMAHSTAVGEGRHQTPGQITIPDVLQRWDDHA